MTNVEFNKLLKEAFESHSLMRNRDYHTINELLYVLEYDSRFKGTDFNISISKFDNSWWSIPGLDAFVNMKTRGIWFDDNAIEFEIDEFEFDGKMIKVNCITVYERGEE